MAFLKARTVLVLNSPKLLAAYFHNNQSLQYNEDYIKLGIHQNATREKNKAAYFVEAKKIHPDSQIHESKVAQAEFNELNGAYKRLM